MANTPINKQAKKQTGKVDVWGWLGKATSNKSQATGKKTEEHECCCGGGCCGDEIAEKSDKDCECC